MYEPATRADAIAPAQRTRDIRSKVLSPGDDAILAAGASLGEVLAANGKFAESEAALAGGLAGATKATDPAMLIEMHVLHGEALIGLGRGNDALPELETAVTQSLAADSHQTGRQIAQAEFALARAIGGGTRAQELARDARERFAADTFPDDERLEAVEAWLKPHP
jgi:hypothetical protein